MMNQQKGFTFVELVIVIVILGILAAVALPRYLNVTDEAEMASAEGVAGGVASAVGIVRAQWEVANRPAGSVVVDGLPVAVNQFGYPSGGNNADAMTPASCRTLFNDILQSPPTNVLDTEDAREARYAVSAEENAGGSVLPPNGGTAITADLCVYNLVSTLTLAAADGIPGDVGVDVGKGFSYNPASGQVVSFNN
ncbi:type II secretion system GspH family protein [Marinobacter hydrocarbonoclasticus]|nr:type II secretion system GspH family protein [Marinobacter nauticus]